MKRVSINMWLSSKWNLIGIYALCSFLIGNVLYDKLTILQLIFIYVLTAIMSAIVWILGVGRGMFLSTMHRYNIDKLLKKLRETAKKENDIKD